MRLLCLFCLSFFLLISETHAQPTQTSTAAGTKKFSTSRGRIKWMGANYRTEWNTPVSAPVFDIGTEKGGLTPVKRGGGKQTKSLRLEDKNGRQYTLRSIQKFVTDKTLPADLQSQAAVDLVSDGISASYPYAALSMAPLADAAGVPYGKVKLVYIPDDPRFGEHQKDFANMLATFEERIPESVDKGYDTDDVADKLEKDNDNDVDQMALLRARILDMFVMDLDRHEDQWQWGAKDNANGKGKTYFPIPRDRDQAFYINQGTLPRIMKSRSLVPQLEGFKVQAHSIERFNFAARNLDRFFLNELTEADWKQAAETFVSQMTDAVIDNALAQQPAEIRGMPSAGMISKTLKERRKFLVAEVMQYYAFISETVSVTGSDKKEIFHIENNSDGSMLVRVNKIAADGSEAVKMYERKFDPLVTREVRLFGFDGEDKFHVTGNKDKIKLRLIGGGGSDVFENTAKNERGGFIYDKLSGNNKVIGRFSSKMSNDSGVNRFERLGYRYSFQSIFFTAGFNPDDGLSLGPTFKHIRHGFRKHPYKTIHQFAATYAFSTKAFNFRYHNEFIGIMGENTDLMLDLEYRGPNNTANFFGYGMNSVYDKSNPGKFRFYRARYDYGEAAIQLRHRFSQKVMLSFGPAFQMYNMDAGEKLNAQRNIVLNAFAMPGFNPFTAFEKQSYFGGLINLSVDTRNHAVLPEKGIHWNSSVRFWNGINDNSYDGVTQVNSDFSFFLNVLPNHVVLANRTGGGATLGKEGFEFFQAQYLGNNDNLRGYRRERFAGKYKFYNQTDLRLKIADFKTYLFPGSIGIVGFFDFGRVWVEDDNVERMATGYGVGLWFSPLRRLNFTFNYAMSKEDKLPLVTMGWRF